MVNDALESVQAVLAQFWQMPGKWPMAAWLHKGDETVPQYELLPTATKQDVEEKGEKSKTGHEPFVGKRKGIPSQKQSGV